MDGRGRSACHLASDTRGEYGGAIEPRELAREISLIGRSLRWIVFEGIDGSGKTTQATLLRSRLEACGIAADYRHVFDTEIGTQLRNLFLSDLVRTPTMETLLLLAAREQYMCDVVRGRSDADRTVLVTDRFISSVLSMQGSLSRSCLELTQLVQSQIMAGSRPDAVVYLDMSARDALARREVLADRVERLPVEFHERVRRAFLSLAQNDPFSVVIDASATVADVHRAIVRALVALPRVQECRCDDGV